MELRTLLCLVYSLTSQSWRRAETCATEGWVGGRGASDKSDAHIERIGGHIRSRKGQWRALLLHTPTSDLFMDACARAQLLSTLCLVLGWFASLFAPLLQHILPHRQILSPRRRRAIQNHIHGDFVLHRLIWPQLSPLCADSQPREACVFRTT